MFQCFAHRYHVAHGAKFVAECVSPTPPPPPILPLSPAHAPPRYAGVRLAAQRSLAGWLSETTGGLTYLEFIRTLGKRVEEDWEGVQVGGWVGGWVRGGGVRGGVGGGCTGGVQHGCVCVCLMVVPCGGVKLSGVPCPGGGRGE
jgi:hypothetical protein